MKKYLVTLVFVLCACTVALSQRVVQNDISFYKKFSTEKDISKLPNLLLDSSVASDSIFNLCLVHVGQLKSKKTLTACELHYLNYAEVKILQKQGKISKALSILKTTLVSLQKNKCDAVALQYVYQDLGANYNYTGKNTLALENYYSALQLATKAKDTVSIGSIDINIGNIYFTLKNFNKAITYYKKSIAISSKNKLYRSLEAKGYDALGGLYLNDDQTLPLAKENLTKAVARYNEVNDEESKFHALNNLGIVYELEGNNNLAMATYQMVYDYGLKTKNKLQVANVCYDMALNYQTLGNNDKAIAYFEESYTNYKKIGMIDGMVDVNNQLSTLYEKQNDYKRALKHFNLFVQYKDSLDKASSSERLMELKKNYEFGIEREQLNTQVVTYQLRNSILVVLIIFLVLIAGLIFSVIKQRAATKEAQIQEQFTFQLLQNTEEERSRIAGELHDSVNHDLLNIKNSLAQGKNIAVEEVASVIEEVRNISRNLHPAVFETIGLEASIENLCERISEIGLFTTCEIDYSKTLSKNKELQLYRIIQEALNNTLKHGKADAAKVILTSKDSILQLEIKDNGNGFDVDKQLKNPKSFGLQSIMQRAKAIAGKININSNKEGTQIYIQIPV